MDYIVRMIAKDAPVKAMAICAADMVERARKIHNTVPVATAALGRTLMVAAMMGDTLKQDAGSVTIRINGGGPLGSILVVSDNMGNARGYVQNAQVDVPSKYPGKLDVGAAVGIDGVVTVSKDLGMREPYVGSTPLVTGEIADDMISYFVESEQTPTACGLGVLVERDYSVDVAGGFLIQLMPGADDETVQKIEKGLRELGAVTPAIKAGNSPQQLLEKVLSGFTLELLEEHPVEYRCYCNRDRMKQALASLGRDELTAILEDQGHAEMTCQFCDAVQQFTRVELEEILNEQ